MGKITVNAVCQMKGREPIAALTVYDYSMARLLDDCGVPVFLVGDSLGMVVLGLPDTTGVTMGDMIHHTRAVSRANARALLTADLPANSYQTPEAAVENARQLVEAGAEAVKAEGGLAIGEQVRAIVAEGIPFLGHLGMLPQNVKEEGGYKIKGRNADERKALIEDAEALVDAGAFALVLELVEPEVARELTDSLPIPTIGIGSGEKCDGQILVTTDLWATSPDFIPKHVQPNTMVRDEMKKTVLAWRDSMR
jgi:3-methyl-2-oxobutanoate hydroxymethyltransferase